MSVKQIGTKWGVYTEEGEFVDMFACKGKAEEAGRHQIIFVEAAETAEKGDEVIAEGDNNEGEEVISTVEAEEEDPFQEEPKADGFPCPQCDFVSKSQVGLSSHMRAKHSAPSKPDF